MANYLYYTERSNIGKEYVAEFLNINKCRMIETEEELQSAMNNLFNHVYIFISLIDDEMIELLSSLQCKPQITVYSKDELVGRTLKDHVADLYLLDDITGCLPTIWGTQVVKYSNVIGLRKIGKKPINFDMIVKPTYTVYAMEYNDEPDGLMSVTFTNYKYTDGIKDFKKEVKIRKNEAKLALKASKSDTKKTYKQEIKVKKVSSSAVDSVNDIGQYMVNNDFLTKEELKALQEIDSDVKELELKALSEHFLSGSEVVEIIRNYYNIDAEDFRTLDCYVYNRKIVSDTLRERGVLECYTPEDTDCLEPYIVINYLDRDKLEDDIARTINYKRLIYTIPDYMEELLANNA